MHLSNANPPEFTVKAVSAQAVRIDNAPLVALNRFIGSTQA